MSSDIPWTKVTFGLGAATFVVAVLKNLTDAGSSWASYGFVALAGAVAAGTYLEWAARGRTARRCSRAEAPRDQVNRLTSSARSSPGPS